MFSCVKNAASIARPGHHNDNVNRRKFLYPLIYRQSIYLWKMYDNCIIRNRMDIMSAKLVYQMDYTRYITFLYLCRNVILYKKLWKYELIKSRKKKKKTKNNTRLFVLHLYCVPLLETINIYIHHLLIFSFICIGLSRGTSNYVAWH